MKAHGFAKTFAVTALLLLLAYFPSFATWSIIIIDPVTKEIGIAGASCTYNCYDIGQIIPGKGAVLVQAMSNKNARKKGVKMLINGATPEQILAEMQKSRFDPERQQYAVLSSKDIAHPVTYTGKATQTYNGAITANGVSVQGNTLTHENELRIILNAALKAQKKLYPISEVLMIALEASSKAGGDKRCEMQTATSAFLIVANPDDTMDDPYLNLMVYGIAKGKENAVTLRAKNMKTGEKKNN